MRKGKPGLFPLAAFTASTSGPEFFDPRRGPPTPVEDIEANAVVADTAIPRVQKLIRRLIGPTAEEDLSEHPERFVIYIREAPLIRACEDEDEVISDVISLVENAPEAPRVYFFALFLEAAFHRRRGEAVAADYVLKRGKPGGTA